MISFFRKIRQKLLSQNRVTRYLAYAVGEILLVVIGILIALQINEWNQQRINKKISLQLHQRLLEDFELIEIRTQSSIADATESMELISFALLCFDQKSIPKGEEVKFDLAIRQFYRFTYPALPMATYDEMKSSGKLDLIYNLEVRNQLNAFISLLESTELILGNAGQSIQNNLIYYDKYIRSETNAQSLNLSFSYDFEKMARS
ncbi:hypothetical protein [Algoriphagus halophilus]|uniref:Uncharacterized protein n=1 Tax=Algoriphagus halophilus TaxID=226505 RepID=A0A1N6G135_9BACT|nr:hypothetical protein [Algoriphagus halophilus]SIO01259.1 hypothetical protein SAMN05444394_2889 [Algoriphagus halophilus]